MSKLAIAYAVSLVFLMQANAQNQIDLQNSDAVQLSRTKRFQWTVNQLFEQVNIDRIRDRVREEMSYPSNLETPEEFRIRTEYLLAYWLSLPSDEENLSKLHGVWSTQRTQSIGRVTVRLQPQKKLIGIPPLSQFTFHAAKDKTPFSAYEQESNGKIIEKQGTQSDLAYYESKSTSWMIDGDRESRNVTLSINTDKTVPTFTAEENIRMASEHILFLWLAPCFDAGFRFQFSCDFPNTFWGKPLDFRSLAAGLQGIAQDTKFETLNKSYFHRNKFAAEHGVGPSWRESRPYNKDGLSALDIIAKNFIAGLSITFIKEEKSEAPSQPEMCRYDASLESMICLGLETDETLQTSESEYDAKDQFPVFRIYQRITWPNFDKLGQRVRNLVH